MKNRIFDFIATWAIVQVAVFIIAGIAIGIVHILDMLPTLVYWLIFIAPIIIAASASYYFNRKE